MSRPGPFAKETTDVLIYFAMCEGAIRALDPARRAELARWDADRPPDVGTCEWPGFAEILGRRPPWIENPAPPRTPDVSAKRRAEVYAQDGRVCQYCGDRDGPFHIDHVTARSRGGTNDLDNLQILCQTCNLSKGCS